MVWRGAVLWRQVVSTKRIAGDVMKFGMRRPSIKKSIAARTSPARFVRHNLGLKAPKGMGLLTSPKKAVYNRVYSRSTFSLWGLLRLLFKA
jgi:hypothetical protein